MHSWPNVPRPPSRIFSVCPFICTTGLMVFVQNPGLHSAFFYEVVQRGSPGEGLRSGKENLTCGAGSKRLTPFPHNKNERSVFWDRVRKTGKCPLISWRRGEDMGGGSVCPSQSPFLGHLPCFTHLGVLLTCFPQHPFCCTWLGGVPRSSENTHALVALHLWPQPCAAGIAVTETVCLVNSL